MSFLFSASFFTVSAQSGERNDTAAIYKLVIDSIYKGDYIVSQTAGQVLYSDIYGNYDEIWMKGVKKMEDEEKLFIICAEPLKYQKSVVAILQEKGIDFDTITRDEMLATGPIDLKNLFSHDRFISFNKAPLGYSYFGNFLKKKQSLLFSELVFLKGLNIAILTAIANTKSNKNEWSELIVLHKEHDRWHILDRIRNG